MEDAPGSPPNRDSTLTFCKVTEANWRAVANLSPKDGQKGNLAPNVWSLCEAHYSEDACVRAIYADETLVGMPMVAIWDPDQAYYIWRFTIDGRYQNLGHGRRGVEFAMAHIRQHNPGAKRLGVMSTPAEGKNSENPLGMSSLKIHHTSFMRSLDSRRLRHQMKMERL